MFRSLNNFSGDALLKSVLFLDVDDIISFDAAIKADFQLRSIWTNILGQTAHIFEQYEHCDSSFRWLKGNLGIMVSHITFNASVRMNLSDDTFTGMNMPNLKALDLSWLANQHEINLFKVAHKTVHEMTGANTIKPSLETRKLVMSQYWLLKVEHKITDLSFLMLRYGASLEAIDLSYWELNVPKTTHAMANLGHNSNMLLEQLNLSYSSISEENFKALLTYFPNLETLDLNNANIKFSEDVFLQEISNSFPKLKYLNMSNIIFNSESTKLHLLSRCEFLEFLEISSKINMTNEDVIIISESCQHLECVTARWCLQLDDTAFCALLKCPSIDSIDLGYCNKIYGVNISTLISSNNTVVGGFRSTVTCLHLFNSGLEDEGLYEIALLCPNLTYLDIDHTGITLDGVKNLLRKCLKMHFISVQCCFQLAETEFRTLMTTEYSHMCFKCI